MHRRDFLAACAGATFQAARTPGISRPPIDAAPPDYTLTIAPLDLELAPGTTVRTVAYNGAVPGPLLRLCDGVPVTIDVINGTGADEFVHWHGLHIPADVDGAADEDTPPVPAHGQQRYTFTPTPVGTRWYHSHTFAGTNLNRSLYTGQFGFLMIDPASTPGRFDQEFFLALHDWHPYLLGGDDGFRAVAYTRASINGRLLGFADPIRVREGQRVLMHLLNASAGVTHWLALPGHRFTVVALDGNAVPNPAAVDVVRIDPGERVDAIVTMDHPGVWILGETTDDVRTAGMGIVVEYAGRSGAPAWRPAAATPWDYLLFGASARPSTADKDVTPIPLVFRSSFAGHGTLEHWTINGKSYPHYEPIWLERGHRYRLVMENQSVEDHPMHLHRHSVELTRVGGRRTAGIIKDVVTVPAGRVVEVDFTADHPGKSLFHCHLQDHMDAGFMTLMDYR